MQNPFADLSFKRRKITTVCLVGLTTKLTQEFTTHATQNTIGEAVWDVEQKLIDEMWPVSIVAVDMEATALATDFTNLPT